MASLHSLRPVALALGLVLAGCNQGSQNDPQQQTGANPALPEPKHFLLPPMKVPEGVGWSGEAKPTVAQGLKIEKIACSAARNSSACCAINPTRLVFQWWKRNFRIARRVPPGYPN